MAKDEALNNRLKKLRENLNEFSQAIITSNKKITKSFDNFSEKIKSSLTKHTEAVKVTTTSVKSFSTNLDKLNSKFKIITDSVNNSSKSLQGIKKVSDALNSQITAAKKTPKGVVPPVAPQGKSPAVNAKNPAVSSPGGKDPKDPNDKEETSGGGGDKDGGMGGEALKYFIFNVVGNQFTKIVQIFSEVNQLVQQSFASNTTLSEQISMTQYSTANRLGISLASLTKEVIGLREVGFRNLDSSVIKLLGRFKATGQSTEGLQRFLGANSVALLRGKEESQKLLVGIEQSARQYGARADQLIEFAGKLTESLEIPSLLGFGDQIQQGISLLAAKTGERGQESLSKFADFLLDTNNQMSIIALGLQDNVAELQRATSPQQSAQILANAAKEAADVIKSRTQGIRGGGSGDILRSSAVLESLGGKQALAAMQVTKALEEQNSSLKINNDDLWNLGSIMDALMNPVIMLGTWLSSLLNWLPKGFTSPLIQFAGGFIAMKALLIPLKLIYKVVESLRKIEVNTSMAAKASLTKTPDMQASKGIELAMDKVSRKAPGVGQSAASKALGSSFGRAAGGFLTRAVPTLLKAIPFVGMAAGLISAGMDIYSSIKDESNRKKEEFQQMKRQQMEKNLGSSILYQLGSVVSSMSGGSGDIDNKNLLKAQLEEMRNLNRNLSSMRNLPDKTGGVGVNK